MRLGCIAGWFWGGQVGKEDPGDFEEKGKGGDRTTCEEAWLFQDQEEAWGNHTQALLQPHPLLGQGE